MDIRRHVLDHLSIDLALFQKSLLRLDTDLSEDCFVQIAQTSNWTLVPIFKYDYPPIDWYFCLRIIPWEPIENWPLVRYDMSIESRVTIGKISRNFLTSLLYFFIGIRSDSEYHVELRERMPELRELFGAAPALLKDERMWQGLLKIIRGEPRPDIFEPHPADSEFLLLSDNSPAHKVLRRELKKAHAQTQQNDEDFYTPKFIGKDYGYLNSLMSNAVLICAGIAGTYHVDLDGCRRAIWRAMSEITFFDEFSLTTVRSIQDVPPFHGNCRDTVVFSAHIFCSVGPYGERENPPIAAAYRGHPMFAVLETLDRAIYQSHIKSALSHIGGSYLALAAHYAGPEHNPRKAWNAAVNAGYWAVAHGGPLGAATSGEALEFAIRLCEENGWAAAHAVLADYHALQRRPLAT